MSRAFRTRSFTRWMRKAGLTDEVLYAAVSEMAQGLIDADLGGHLVKKRVALPGQGKRGGAHTIVATKMADRWFFVLGFAKNERANIDAAELKALQELAKHYLGFDDRQIEQAIDSGVLTEVRHDHENA
ncbi:MAG: type II toxin-antitoxin system RelE/ParE family toxin [Pseudomonadota bacterium]